MNFAYDEANHTVHDSSDAGFDGTNSFGETTVDFSDVTDSGAGMGSYSDGSFLMQISAMHAYTDSIEASGYVGTLANYAGGYVTDSISNGYLSDNATDSYTLYSTLSVGTASGSGSEDPVIEADYGGWHW